MLCKSKKLTLNGFTGQIEVVEMEEKLKCYKIEIKKLKQLYRGNLGMINRFKKGDISCTN